MPSILADILGAEMSDLGGSESLAQEGVSFTVDGVKMSATQNSRRIRLSCVVTDRTPDEERALRRLLSQYLRYADHGTEILYCDSAGRLLLTAEIALGVDARDRAAEFFDAAIHWTKVAHSLAVQPEPVTRPAVLIFP